MRQGAGAGGRPGPGRALDGRRPAWHRLTVAPGAPSPGCRSLPPRAVAQLFIPRPYEIVVPSTGRRSGNAQAPERRPFPTKFRPPGGVGLRSRATRGARLLVARPLR